MVTFVKAWYVGHMISVSTPNTSFSKCAKRVNKVQEIAEVLRISLLIQRLKMRKKYGSFSSTRHLRNCTKNPCPCDAHVPLRLSKHHSYQESFSGLHPHIASSTDIILTPFDKYSFTCAGSDRSFQNKRTAKTIPHKCW